MHLHWEETSKTYREGSNGHSVHTTATSPKVLSRLERYEPKASRTVLRGGRRGNPPYLPGNFNASLRNKRSIIGKTIMLRGRKLSLLDKFIWLVDNN